MKKTLIIVVVMMVMMVTKGKKCWAVYCGLLHQRLQRVVKIRKLGLGAADADVIVMGLGGDAQFIVASHIVNFSK